jgi:hypothetical protein
MADPTVTAPAPDPKLALRWLAVAVFAGGLVLAGWQVARDRTPSVRHPSVVSTAWVSFALWAGAVGLMIPATAAEWRPGVTRYRVARWAWVLGAAMFLVHFLVAFHFAHRWRHANAFEHVNVTAGFGPGIFVSYTFTALWLADAVWWVLAPAGYAGRSRWVGWAVHAFMAFITFNGTVVYVHGWIRWMAVGVFVALGAALVWRRVRVWAVTGRPPAGTRPREGSGSGGRRGRHQ